MDLSLKEKLLLANQYEILKRLDPQEKAHYELLLTCLYDGYLQDFQQLIPHFEERLNPSVQSEVRDILEMFRAIHPGDGEKPPAVFGGFDGNDEAEHYGYAKFLLEDRGLWQESKDDGNGYNTHANVLDDYRAMLAIWNQAADKNNPSADEIAQIVKAAPYHSKPK